MRQDLSGSLRLFRFAGIDVYLHWSWFLVALIEFQFLSNQYRNPVFNFLEYLSLFVIVLLHEFGHALACRSVGGQADRIVLWPLGGIAFVNPPPRPGPVLLSIVAGPLVNVLLLFPTIGFYVFSQMAGWHESLPDIDRYLRNIAVINGLLLFFNLLPVYPLDGGQILQALLWFIIGRSNSLFVVSVIGLLGAAGFGFWAIQARSIWIGVIAAFIALRAVAGFQFARVLAFMAKAPRHHDCRCPFCGTPPIANPMWQCEQCGQSFDMFANRGVCPNCSQRFNTTVCPECQRGSNIADWYAVPNQYAAHYEPWQR